MASVVLPNEVKAICSKFVTELIYVFGAASLAVGVVALANPVGLGHSNTS